jgi:hypothetical protein
MKFRYLPSLAALTIFIGSAQTPPPQDPAQDSTGLPAYMKLIPRPAAEPFRMITEKQRLALFASTVFSPMAGLSAAAGAAISQGINSPEEWGQGWGPYGKRVASSYSGTLIGNTITYGTSAMFREDNRYFQSHKSGAMARLGAVLISPYQARNSAGHVHFSYSSLLGGAGQASIPLAWSPPSWQSWGDVALNYSIWYGTIAGVNFAREFYPSLVRYYRSKVLSSKPASKPAAKN